MVDPDQIEALLADMENDTAPLSDTLRSAILADAAAVAETKAPAATVPWWRRTSLWGGALGVPLAALCGLWLGIAQPSLVLQAVPGLDVAVDETTDDTLFDDLYGSSWEDWL